MKNITVTVDDALYHRARIKAAERHSTVSALVRAFLVRLVEEESEFERLQRLQDDTLARIRERAAGYAAGSRLTRDEVHDRDALR